MEGLTLHNLKIRGGKFENIEGKLGPDIIKDKVIYAINMLKKQPISRTRPIANGNP